MFLSRGEGDKMQVRVYPLGCGTGFRLLVDLLSMCLFGF